jgi:hypothetical protein
MQGVTLVAGGARPYVRSMRITSSVTSLSWIPSEAISGLTKLPFDVGIAHYDDPPPDRLDAAAGSDLEALRVTDRFRFANELRAWIEVEDGRIVDHGLDSGGGGRMGSTTVRLGGRAVEFAAFALPDLQPAPEVGDGWVRFVQTAGGRTGVPAPRRVARPPYAQWEAPLVWTTLALTIHADGRSAHEVLGHSTFPRCWIYGADGRMVAKSGLMDFKHWYRHAFGKHSPWGDEDSPALVTAVETALERELSASIMRGGAAPAVRKVAAGRPLMTQGEPGDEVFLLLDGVVAVDVDGRELVELGPGAILGERAVLEGGTRTSTVRAVTACKVAVAPSTHLDPTALAELSTTHRREDER